MVDEAELQEGDRNKADAAQRVHVDERTRPSEGDHLAGANDLRQEARERHRDQGSRQRPGTALEGRPGHLSAELTSFAADRLLDDSIRGSRLPGRYLALASGQEVPGIDIPVAHHGYWLTR